jgi:hypothetical protein
MSLEKDIGKIMEAFPMPQSPQDKADGPMGKSISPLPGKEPAARHPDLYKRTPIVKADWECEVIPTAKGGYGFTLIIYKDGEEIKRQAGFGSVAVAQVEARDYVLLEEFDISRENEE